MSLAVSSLRQRAEMIRPPRRMRVSEAAQAAYVVNEPGGYYGPLDLSIAPYMIDPMDALASRKHSSVVFVGPARAMKTMALVEGGLTYVVTCDPGDALIVQMSQDAARDYSATRLARMFRASPVLRAQQSASAQDDNTFDKAMRSGMVVKIGWPAISQVSSKSIRWVFVTDYDRCSDDIDGEGDLFTLAGKRTQTFLSRGMTCIESSPGREVRDPKWRALDGSHAAPPAGGILSVYDRGDRRRWYWPCPECGEFHQARPGLGNFCLPPESDLLEMVRTESASALADRFARIACPHCGVSIGREHRRAMNAGGVWLADGLSIDRERRISGTPRGSPIASFWLGGVAACFQPWPELVGKHLQALATWQATGDESALKGTCTNDQGAPYTPRAMLSDRDARALEARREELPRGIVPHGVRFLVAATDVQAHRWVAQVIGYGVDGERWIVDRFDVSVSARIDLGTGDALAADPAAYLEDWSLLTARVLLRGYPLADGSGRRMPVRVTACDSGGRDGVTERAYAYWRQCRKAGIGSKLMLIKGDHRPGIPRVSKSFPDNASGSKRKANARGQIPVWLLNANALKDGIDAALKRTEPGGNYIHLPNWLASSWFDEIASEVRTDKGWMTVKKGIRNESFDLLAYAHAVALELGIERINWSRPPAWAAPWNENPEIIPAETANDPPTPAPHPQPPEARPERASSFFGPRKSFWRR